MRVAPAGRGYLAVQQGHNEGTTGGDDAGDAAADELPLLPSASQQQPPRKQVTVTDIDLVGKIKVSGVPTWLTS